MRHEFPHQPALDGLRGVSVALVLLFHAGVPFLQAGYLGVSVFFTLSGYLITSLLLVERARTGTVRVGAFYGRRVKRLLPASTLCIAGVVVARQFGAFDDVPHLRADVLGAVLQVYNWVRLAGTGSYGDLFASATSPLEHYWSLAIEEQFYWVWPVVVMVASRRAVRRVWSRRRVTVALAIVTVAVSLMAPLIASVFGPDAAYWATPARLPEILIGALLAVVLHGRWVPANASRLAPPALVGIVAAAVLLPADRGPAYEGWLPLFAVLSATLIYALQAPGWVRRLLTSRLLVSMGAISYGLYLFHWPVYVFLRGRGWELATLSDLVGALAITLAISLVSYRLVERPVRHTGWRPARALRLAAVASVAVLASSVLVAPGVPAIRADAELLGAAAIAPAGPDDSLAPLAPASSADDAITSDDAISSATSGDTGVEGERAGEPATSDPSAPAPSAPSSGPVVDEVQVDLPAAPARPVRVLVVGDSTALYLGHGLAAWTMAHPAHAQVSVTWCQGCTFLLEPEIVSFGLDEVIVNSRRTIGDTLPDAIRQLRPDVVVLMATVSEAADRQWNSEEGPLGPLDSRFRERMVEAYADLTMEIVSAGVPDVVWVVPPTPTHDWDEPEMNERERYAAHHAIIRDATSRFSSHVSVLDLDAWATATGKAGDDTWRADGVHIDEGPATELAEQFVGPWLVREALAP